MPPRIPADEEDIRQVVKTAGSLDTNYIEANDSLERKDFVLHIKTSDKGRMKVNIGFGSSTREQKSLWTRFASRSSKR